MPTHVKDCLMQLEWIATFDHIDYSLDPKHECSIAVGGLFNLFIFDDNGRVLSTTKFGPDLYRATKVNCGIGVEIPPHVRHTVIPLSNSATVF